MLINLTSIWLILTVFAWYRGGSCSHIVNENGVCVGTRFVVLGKCRSGVWCGVGRYGWGLVGVQYAVLVGVIRLVHAAPHAAAQLQSPHVANHGRGVEGLLICGKMRSQGQREAQ